MNSPISFYQMIGRGTRIDMTHNKLMFRVYDYTNASRLFGEKFLTKATKSTTTTEATTPDALDTPDEPGRAPLIYVKAEGFEHVQISQDGRFILSLVDGKSMPVPIEEYTERLRTRVAEAAPALDDLRGFWVEREQRLDLLRRLPDGGQSAGVIRTLRAMLEYDLYDVLAQLAYQQTPFTRDERAQRFATRQAAWLQDMPTATAATTTAIVRQFARAGIDGLESRYVWQTPEVQQAGGLTAIKAIGKPAEVLREIKERLLAA
jgi:type I restriction enzyme R subunit